MSETAGAGCSFGIAPGIIDTSESEKNCMLYYQHKHETKKLRAWFYKTTIAISGLEL